MKSQQVIVQYRIPPLGTDRKAGAALLEKVLDRRRQIEELLNEAVESADLGYCDGGDIGGGTLNIFIVTPDANVAQEFVIRTLRKHNELDDAVIAVDDRLGDKTIRVVWPEGFEGEFQLT